MRANGLYFVLESAAESCIDCYRRGTSPKIREKHYISFLKKTLRDYDKTKKGIKIKSVGDKQLYSIEKFIENCIDGKTQEERDKKRLEKKPFDSVLEHIKPEKSIAV